MITMDFSVNWKDAIKCCLKVIKNPADTKNVFALARAANGPALVRSYHKLLKTKHGGEIAYTLPEFVDLYPFLPNCPAGSVGAELLNNQPYPIEVLIRASKRGTSNSINMKHPYLWLARRERDAHDLYHTLTGYKADVLGEWCVAAFTSGQTKSYHWGLIFLAGIWREKFSLAKLAAIFEAYVRGKQCIWLLGENYEQMINQNLEECRNRLRIQRAKMYEYATKN